MNIKHIDTTVNTESRVYLHILNKPVVCIDHPSLTWPAGHEIYSTSRHVQKYEGYYIAGQPIDIDDIDVIERKTIKSVTLTRIRFK